MEFSLGERVQYRIGRGYGEGVVVFQDDKHITIQMKSGKGRDFKREKVRKLIAAEDESLEHDLEPDAVCCV